ncbi:MAG: ADP-ribosylglycohydrolase family protein [Prevotella sp.]|nr:ADP-ribosylglycohydrolase family protein [Prevotella sp.]
MEKYKDKVLGSMMGGAVGDALGYPIGTMTYKQIIDRYGDKGFTRYVLNKKGEAEISDGTQMSLFTANGVLVCFTRYACHGILGAGPADYIRDSYLEWLQTQIGNIDYTHWHCNWIRDVRELHKRRTPGTTCISALQQLAKHETVENNSKGCGGIMRTAPIPLFMANPYMACDTEFIVKTAMKTAEITHKHPLGQLPAALLAYIIAEVMPLAYATREQLRSYINSGLYFLKKHYPDHQAHLDKLKGIIDVAVKLSGEKDKSDAEAIALLGKGWAADETLAIAIYCVLKYSEDFEKAIIAAVNHSGNSASTGAVTGNIMGALWGYDAIPAHFKEHLELRWLIEEISTDLATGIIVSEYIDCYDTPEKRRWMSKYVDLVQKDCVPIKNSYLVHRELNIYAGEYPGDKTEYECKLKLGQVAFKCSYFFDLTTPGELMPYNQYLDEIGRGMGEEIYYGRFPIANCGIPSNTSSVARLLDKIIEIGKNSLYRAIYIHDWGGVGRTGTIVACLYAYLLKGKGLSADVIYKQAIHSLDESFYRYPKSKNHVSPENNMQRDFIRRFIQNECV